MQFISLYPDKGNGLVQMSMLRRSSREASEKRRAKRPELYAYAEAMPDRRLQREIEELERKMKVMKSVVKKRREQQDEEPAHVPTQGPSRPGAVTHERVTTELCD